MIYRLISYIAERDIVILNAAALLLTADEVIR